MGWNPAITEMFASAGIALPECMIADWCHDAKGKPVTREAQERVARALKRRAKKAKGSKTK